MIAATNLAMIANTTRTAFVPSFNAAVTDILARVVIAWIGDPSMNLTKLPRELLVDRLEECPHGNDCSLCVDVRRELIRRYGIYGI